MRTDREANRPASPRRTPGARRLSAAAGLAAGLVAGLAVTLALVVARAHLGDVYIQDVVDMAGWPALPLVLLPAAGVALGWLGGLGAATAGAGLGGAAATVAGALVGAGASAEPWPPWAGAVVGAGVGVLLGAAAGLALRTRRRGPRRADAVGGRPVPRGASRTGRWIGALGVALAMAAAGIAAATRDGGPPPPLPDAVAPPPDTAAVAAVVLLLGDPGEATLATHPVLPRVRRDIERWSSALGPDGDVVMVVLGDLVYPAGLSPPDDPAWERDSTRLAHQVALLAGPEARRAGARGLFLAGNHDWGAERGSTGLERVERLEAFLDRRRAEGVAVSLEPPAGSGGPSVLDLGERLRLVLLDTAWWLLEADRSAKEAVVRGVERAMATAGGRRVVVAAHHPFESAGPHGTLAQIGETLGLRTLLSRSGAMLQDLGSPPYRELRRDLLGVFGRTGPPALFAGGHEHSLQVVRVGGASAPRTSLVSGAASRLSEVGPRPGAVVARSAPGFATLLVMRDGGLRLRVDAAPARFVECAGEGRGATCVAEGVAAFRTVWEGAL